MKSKNIFQKFLFVVQEDVIGTENKVLAIAFILCIGGLIALGVHQSSDTAGFLGIADSRELQINFEYPVELKNVNVLPGQPVKKGDLLLELSQSELNAKLRQRQADLARLEAELKVRGRMNLLVKNNGTSGEEDPLVVSIRDVQAEVNYLQEQKKKLFVFAEMDGVVGTVSFKKGEQAPAFASILTLSPGRPTYIDGFMHESLTTKLEIGKTVKVKPVATTAPSVEGVIVSVGSRIIPMPVRLQRNPDIPMFGRSVVIEISPENQFLLGEKVEISPFGGLELSAFPAALANSSKKVIETTFPSDPQDMKVPTELIKNFAFAPSGVVYLEDAKKYLIVSEDAEHAKNAVIFMSDSSGNVSDQVLQIPGITKVSDLESISKSGPYLYLLSSQAMNKKQKNKADRNFFIRIKRSGLTLAETESFELRPLLLKALQASTNADIRNIAKNSADLEIESHFVDGETLYLALKNPLLDGNKSAILKITNVSSLFATKDLKPDHVTMWRSIDFGKVNGAPMHLSDFSKLEGQLYATTVCESEKCGAVWKIKELGDHLIPEIIREFPDTKPKGVAMDPVNHSLFVTFDQKETPAKYVNVHLQAVAEAKDGK